MNLKKISTLLIATTVSLCALQTANAQGYSDTNSNDLAQNQSLTRTSFTTRFDQIRGQIRDALAQRKLSQGEADGYSSRLNSLSTETDGAFYSGGGISNQELAGLMPKLQAFGEEVARTVNGRATGSASTTDSRDNNSGRRYDNRDGDGRGYGYGNRDNDGRGYGHGNGNSNDLIGPINLRITALQTRFTGAITTGNLSTAEQQDIRASFDALTSMRDRAVANGLHHREANDLNQEIDRLTLKVDQAIASPEWNNGPLTGTFDQKMNTLNERLTRASRRHLLSLTQTKSAENSMHWMETVAREMTASGDFGPDEQQLLSRSMDKLATRINGWIADNRRNGGASYR
jgi:hypothetical protein